MGLSCHAVALEPLDAEFAKGGPAIAVCEELRRNMLFYHGLFLQGGNAKQMEVWKKQYKKYLRGYGNSNCRKLAKMMMPSKAGPALASTN
ncbi:MAG: hypothetical protein HRT77_08635 [Halioglobus sp.]|nr:hypothetical protein [Halioglobus sp.]